MKGIQQSVMMLCAQLALIYPMGVVAMSETPEPSVTPIIIASTPAKYEQPTTFVTDVPLEFPDFFITCISNEFHQPAGAAASAAYNLQHFVITQPGKQLLELEITASENAIKPTGFTVDGKNYLLYTGKMPGERGETLYSRKLAIFKKR